MYLAFDFYFDKKTPVEQLRKNIAGILGLPVFFIPREVPQNLEDAVLVRLYKRYRYTGFSIEWDTNVSTSRITDNFEMAKRLAVEFNTQVVTTYEGDNEFEYDWYLCDPQGNWFLVDDDDDEDIEYEQFLYDTKRPAKLPIAKTPAAA